MGPGCRSEDVLFALAVVDSGGLHARVVWHLEVVEAKAGIDADLVSWIGVIDEGSKSSAAVCLIMQVDAGRRLKSPIGVVAAEAEVVRELRGVVAKTQQVVRLVIVSVAGDEFCLTVAFKSGVWSDVKDAVHAITVLGSIAARLGLQIGNVLGIELRSDVGSDVGVGDRNAVNCPSHLMAAANMQLVVHHVRAGNKLRDDLEAIAGIHPGIAGYLFLGDENVSANVIGGHRN